MPYIEQKERVKFENILESIKLLGELSDGETNYLLSSIILLQTKSRGECYTSYNSLIGVLESVKLEYYRVQVSNYEDEKMKINGSI